MVGYMNEECESVGVDDADPNAFDCVLEDLDVHRSDPRAGWRAAGQVAAFIQPGLRIA